MKTISVPGTSNGAARSLHGAPAPVTGANGACRGFTLLELMVVIVLIAIFTVLIVPRPGGNEGKRLRAESEKLMMLINLAQQEAIMTSRVWQVWFDPDRRGYGFSKQADGGFEPVAESPYTGDHRMESIHWDRLVVNGERVKDRARVNLYPTGEHDPFKLVLVAGGHEKSVSMNALGTAGPGE